MAASLMAQEFDKRLADPLDKAMRGGDPMAFMVSKAGLKMCFWYGTLFVVVEGWKESRLSDPEVDRLLSSPKTELLRRFRNGMFHFQTDHWLPTKFSSFFEPSRSLMAEMNRISGKSANP
jgi:hypothetical protein